MKTIKLKGTRFTDLSQEILSRGSLLRFWALGSSMEPFLFSSDILTVKPASSSELKRGDIILFEDSTGNPILHRIQKKSKKILVRGDNLLSASEEVPTAKILGKVINIERNGKKIDISPFSYWRYYPKLCLYQLARLFNSDFLISVPGDSIKSVAEKFNQEEEVNLHSDDVADGFEDWERDFVEEFMTKKGKVLDIGCGAGREAIALAKLGFDVVGIDIASKMVEKAKENARKENLSIKFEVKRVIELDYPDRTFDYILFSRAIYSFIPTRKLRVKVLKSIKRILKKGGLAVFSAYIVTSFPTLKHYSSFIFRKVFALLLGKGFSSEFGDIRTKKVSEVDSAGRCFCHFFSNPEEIKDEIKESGLSLVRQKDGFWIVTP
ncbi:MAG: methyltransferase domain-containing protein [Candidatus Zixiibacteriota bacterium]